MVILAGTLIKKAETLKQRRFISKDKKFDLKQRSNSSQFGANYNYPYRSQKLIVWDKDGNEKSKLQDRDDNEVLQMRVSQHVKRLFSNRRKSILIAQHKYDITDNPKGSEQKDTDGSFSLKEQTDTIHFYYNKYFYTHSFIVLLLVVQYALYSFLRITENAYYDFNSLSNDSSLQVPDGDNLENKQHILHMVVVLCDVFLIVQYWALDYHKIVWEMAQGNFCHKGIDISKDQKMIPYLKNQLKAYQGAIQTTIMLLIRPFKLFNGIKDYYQFEGLNDYLGFDFSKQEITPLMRQISAQINIHGALNDFLTIVFTFVRVSLLTSSMIYLVSPHFVQQYRVGKIMGFEMSSWRLYKFFYMSHKWYVLVWGLVCLGCIFIMLTVEFERFNIMAVMNQFWYMVCTITTVGYGDYYSKNLFGQIITVWAVFTGSFMEAIFVVTLYKSISLDGFEQGAYYNIKVEEVDLKAKQQVVRWIECLFKARKINRRLEQIENGTFWGEKAPQKIRDAYFHEITLEQKRLLMERKEAKKLYKKLQLKSYQYQNDKHYKMSIDQDEIRDTREYMTEVYDIITEQVECAKQSQMDKLEDLYQMSIIINEEDQFIKCFKLHQRVRQIRRNPGTHFLRKFHMRLNKSRKASVVVNLGSDKGSSISLSGMTYPKQYQEVNQINQNIISDLPFENKFVIQQRQIDELTEAEPEDDAAFFQE